jgi:hypothetical protein
MFLIYATNSKVIRFGSRHEIMEIFASELIASWIAIFLFRLFEFGAENGGFEIGKIFVHF